MVSVSKLINGGLIASGQTVFQQLATPEQSSVQQYNIVRYLGGQGPYISATGSGISTDIPSQCSIEQVQVIHRHGERFPTTNKGQKFERVMDKFNNYANIFQGPLQFLNDYEYFVTDPSYYDMETTPENSNGLYAGTTDALRHGAAFRARYNSLYNQSEVLPVFTSSNTRVWQTSQYFIRGFLGDQYDPEHFKTVILSEDDEMGANSLTPASSCSAWDAEEKQTVIDQYNLDYLKDIQKRLLEKNKGLNLTTDDVQLLFDWCAYEINVRGSSPFCDLFTQDELVKNEYYIDLSQYYYDGNGNSAILPIGSVLFNASLNLLKDSDSNNKIWLSFTHDTDIENYLAAVGIFQPENDLTPEYIPYPNIYHHAEMVPQGARVYTEKYKCNDDSSYVRYIVNDAVIPIKNCSSGPGFSCEFHHFENYVHDRLEGVNYADQCKIGNATSELSFYWDYNEVNYDAKLSRFSY